VLMVSVKVDSTAVTMAAYSADQKADERVV
jgi:hypothetical protein